MKRDLGESLFVSPPIKARITADVLCLLMRRCTWVGSLDTGVFIGPLRAKLKLDNSVASP